MSALFRYCPFCRADLQTRRIPEPDGPERRVCGACGFVDWNNSKPSASGIVEDHKGRVLLARRVIEPARGCWDVPGGFLEPGEHPEQGVVRELREETGLAVQVERLVGVYMDIYGSGAVHTLNFYYLCRARGGTPLGADDVGEVAWFAAEDLPDNLAFQNTRDALRDWQIKDFELR